MPFVTYSNMQWEKHLFWLELFIIFLYIFEFSCFNFFFSRDIPEEVLNTYCWIHSTYTVMEAAHTLKNGEGGSDVAYPGVENSGKTPTKQVKYYQWVAFMLFFQVNLYNSSNK